jgi:hypothetical protein
MTSHQVHHCINVVVVHCTDVLAPNRRVVVRNCTADNSLLHSTDVGQAPSFSKLWHGQPNMPCRLGEPHVLQIGANCRWSITAQDMTMHRRSGLQSHAYKDFPCIVASRITMRSPLIQ